MEPRACLVAAGLLVALALSACTSRTLPLPPPDVDPLDAPNAQGLVLVRGTAQEGASVGVLNDRTMTGTIVTSSQADCDRTCPFEATVAAEPGDRLRVWQFFETTSATELEVPAP